MTKQRLTRLMPLLWAILIVLSALASVSATPSAAGGFEERKARRPSTLGRAVVEEDGRSKTDRECRRHDE